MRICYRIAALCASVLLMVAFCVPVQAHDVPDLTKEGTVSVTFDITSSKYGTLCLYQVGEVKEDDGNYWFAPLEPFKSKGITFETLLSTSLPEDVYDIIQDEEVPEIDEQPIQEVGEKVMCEFTGVKPGLYLVAQGEKTRGYSAISPFLVSMPYMQNGTYLYDVDASAKTGLEQVPETLPEPPHDKDDLPQTGQLNWPVPVLAVLGLSVFVAGWVLYAGRREKDEA